MKYIWDKSKMKWVDAAEYRRPVRMHNVMLDIQEFQSPIDNSVISSRSHKRAHMRQHGVEEAGGEKIRERAKPAYEPKGLRESLKRTCEELGY